ncbi:MAG: hypothetical protein RLZZ511_1621 [Cyanobacteriota bacterium]
MHVLSIPTWMIHISSVIEWIAVIALIWQFAIVMARPAWRMLCWGMLPALISAMCACTWHFYDNAVRLEWLVTLQAAMTLVGNCTMMAAAWWIWRQAVKPEVKDV